MYTRLDHDIPGRPGRARRGTGLMLDGMAEALRDLLRAEASGSRRVARQSAREVLETYDRFNRPR